MYSKIMVPLDGSELAECVLSHVESIIDQCRIQAIVFVRILATITPAVAGEYAINLEEIKNRELEREAEAKEYLEQAARRFQDRETEIETVVLFGRAADRLADYAENHGVELILMATHGRSGVSRWVRGSVADRILRAASVPVLMVRAPGTATGKPV